MFIPVPIDARRAQQAFTALRLLLALIIALHGWHRFLNDGYQPFGAWLDGQGFPFGLAIASAITAFEIFGSPLYALGRFVFPLTLGYAGIYLMGIWLVHLPAGWFVVGAGRNGAEFSVLLIACLLLVGWQHAPARLGRT